MTGTGALSAGVWAAIFSHDWCFTVLAATILGAFVGGLSERLLNRPWAIRWRPRLPVRIALVLCAGVLIGHWLRLNESAAFERTFGVPAPSGVRYLQVEKHYGGGPGDFVMLIRFTADKKTFGRIVTSSGLKEDTGLTKVYPPSENWLAFWRHLFQVSFGGEEWESVQPITDPKVYFRSCPSPGEHMRVLWDPASGRVYAMYGFG